MKRPVQRTAGGQARVGDRWRPSWVPSVAAAALMLSLAAWCSCGGAASARAAVYHSRASALQMAFPGADTVVARDLILTPAQAQRIEQSAGSRLTSRLVTLYTARQDTALVGYALFETHTVRTLPATLLVVLDPQGRIRAVHLLAFHEPPEYEPPPRWLDQFQGSALSPELSLRCRIAGIAGSTLTASAVTAAVRRVLAIWQVAVRGAS